MNENFFNRFSASLKQILLLAERIASDLGDQLDTQHIIYAIVSTRDNLSSDILKSYDVSAKKVDVLSRIMSRSKKQSRTTVSRDLKNALMSAIRITANLGLGQIEVEHVLLSLLSEKRFNSYQIIERAGANPEKIKGQLTEMFDELKLAVEQNQDLFNQIDGSGQPDELGFDFPGHEGAPFAMPGTPGVGVKDKSLLEIYGTNLNDLAKVKKLDPVIGRDVEITRMVQILSRRHKNNPILLGEPGVGKTAIVEGLAEQIVKGKVPSNLLNMKIISLDLGAIVAGTMFRGQFEARFKKIIEEITKLGNIIIFLDELHTVIGTGSAEGSLDAANLLKPLLSRGQLKLIGATTFDEYKKNIERDKAFERRFQIVKISEPTVDETIKILNGLKIKYEDYHHISYLPGAIEAAVKLSDRYIADRFLPDKAIDLIDEAAASTNTISKNSSQIMALQNQLAEIAKRKEEAVNNENYQLATGLKADEIAINNKLKSYENDQKEIRQKVITSEDIASIVASTTGIPVSSLKIAETVHLVNLEKRLRVNIVGQDQAIHEISQAIKRSRVGIADPNRPIGSFIFLGPTGVGKTELARVLAKTVFGSQKALVKIDMSEFMEKHNVARLVGAPAGYVGYEEGGKLTETIRHQPYSLILFDEIEKAHPDFYNLLLQILEDGYLTDAKGRRVNFKNTLIIMTSNLGSSLFSNKSIGFAKNGETSDVGIPAQVEENLRKNLPPEFLNRLDKIIVFNQLTQHDIGRIVNLRLKDLEARIKTLHLNFEMTIQAKELLAAEGFDKNFGARPLKRVIANQIESKISDLILKYPDLQGKTIKVDRQADKFAFSVI